MPPDGIDGLGFAGLEDADADGGGGIVKAEGEKFVLAIVNDGEFAGDTGAVGFADAIPKDPRVAGADIILRRRGDAEAQARRFFRDRLAGGGIHWTQLGKVCAINAWVKTIIAGRRDL